ncbi:class I SAM-dependent methyltransferase [Paenibacillus sp. MMS20-IR301]|uniref:class I SAM-dependent methyltransferase n=1 Tax=Paenibacillus sp. MMS20-IR301 TaxID=2895946 RepID=UPI0028E27328|nr:class I SAM-dependent methyltransferase [Paenibacillus sp. MMS20-IR301]WNS41379.1 class I SAM-dependent methyltransferase [Paenibacillus sp. MMS20-IR301]
MLKSLQAIEAYREGGQLHLGGCQWLQYIVQAEQAVVNLERVGSLRELEQQNPVLDYVERSLVILDRLPLSYWIKELVEETLVWSETAKGGTLRQRRGWQAEGINIFVHNIGSAELYRRYAVSGGEDAITADKRLIVHRLIETHGLIGQQLRGEVPPSVNLPLPGLVEQGLLTAEELERLLLALNHCIIAAVSPELWQELRPQVTELIADLCAGELPAEVPMKERLRRMRAGAIAGGEAYDAEWSSLVEAGFAPARLEVLQPVTFWYVESALQTFSLEQFLKVVVLAGGAAELPGLGHISFEAVMNGIYYDYKGSKKINVYKKRIIEKYLSELDWTEINSGAQPSGNPHLSHRLLRKEHLPDTLFFSFEFSPAAEKLIEFCIEAEKSALYERAVLLLFDLFGLRRDAFDRFHNEDTYLSQMNDTADYKAVILDYVTGRKVLDIGPGGGVLLDLIEQRMPEAAPVGIDISSNVIEALRQRKQREGRRWEVLQGDALNLKDYVEAGTVDTVIFSSILHELYSYVPLNGRKFNHSTVAAALASAFEVLADGGVIIIRDGIMTEPAELRRRVRLLEADGMDWLKRYTEDFAGRDIQVEQLSTQEVLMPVNDAMEFLYTYTWGEEAYIHEVQEQFGYFTPTEYTTFINQTLGGRARIEIFRHYLQEGYTEALQDRVVIMDESGQAVPLPDSTCFIVIRKVGERELLS